ncbi:MAG TPA: MFS transporter [Alphaproteobacteria bacterium]|jgi:MFS family permease|nr:MFS transporter [Alphaproteobacteria bacterium]MDP6268773.1 MFS transporter [Alphaproteobacteria bacterium]MDP7163844.1 MFS transporter [Alphaproteobacteria bacterium]MDP7428475.1 MFS transporter [Alphaproteobacteria bacterium]HJM52104.1 MFS transporter [Alphaproteobacteria bacterium]
MNSVRASLFAAVQRRFFFGWAVLAVAAVSFFASGPGQSHTFSVFIEPLSRDLGMAQTSIASAYAIATLVAALGLPRMGGLVDRYGVWRVMLVVSVLLGLACVAFGTVSGGITLALGFAALRFLGQGSLMLFCANLVAQWFHRKRGFAMSIMALGFSASMALHPPLVQWLVDSVGWRQAWLWLGIMTWAILLPLVLLLVHNKPEDCGLLPDGDAPETAAGEESAAAVAGLTLKQAIRTGAFWIISVSLFTPAALVTALFFFQVSIFQSQGLSQQMAAQIFTVSGVMMVLAIPVFGRILDRFPTQYVFAGALVLLSLTMLTASLVDNIVTALIYGALFGANNATNITFFSYIWARYFGRKHLGSVQGAGQMIGVVGASVGPLPFGLAFDLSGSYIATLQILALVPLGCSVLALFLRTPSWDVED